MIARTIFAVIIVWSLTAGNTAAQFAPVPAPAGPQDNQITAIVTVGGKVFADGVPVSRMIRVRLERQDSSIIDYAYTRGSYDFKFQDVLLERNQKYYLIIDEPGFKELRYSFDLFDLFRNPFGTYTNHSSFILALESLPKPGQESANGPKVVDVRNISNPIPKDAQQEYDLAIKELTGGNNAAALLHLEKAVELAPKYYDAISRLGTEYLKSGKYEKAEAMLQQARDLNPKDPINLTNLGALYFQKGDKESAIVGDAGLHLGEASYRKAVNVLEEALQLDPQAPRANFYLGTALCRTGDYERAESLLNNALMLDKNLLEARLSLLNIYIRSQRYDAALEQISAYLEGNPNASQREEIEKFRIQIKNAMDQMEEF